MNKIFKVIWNYATQSWVAVSELQKAKGKTKSLSKAVAISALVSVATPGYAASVVEGDGATASAQGIALGDNAKATGSESPIAIGVGAEAANKNDIAIGNKAGYGLNDKGSNFNGSGKFSFVGNGTFTTNTAETIATDSNLAIGINAGTNATGRRNIAIGENAATQHFGEESITIGYGANNFSGTRKNTDGRALAAGDTYRARRTIAIGKEAMTYGEESIAIGYGANTKQASFNSGANYTNASNAVALGRGASASGDSSFAQGYFSSAQGQGDIAIGIAARTLLDPSLPNNARNFRIAIGRDAKIGEAALSNSLAIGSSAKVLAGNNGVALGSSTQTIGNNLNVALGSSSRTWGDRPNAIGNSNTAGGFDSSAIGAESHVLMRYGTNGDTSNNGVAVGAGAVSGNSYAVALGNAVAVFGMNSGALSASSKNPNAVNSLNLGDTTQLDSATATKSPITIIGGSENFAIGNNNVIGSSSNNNMVMGNRIAVGATGATTNGNINIYRLAIRDTATGQVTAPATAYIKEGSGNSATYYAFDRNAADYKGTQLDLTGKAVADEVLFRHIVPTFNNTKSINRAVAIGQSASVNDNDTIAIGTNSKAGDSSKAADATANAIAIGTDSIANASQAISIGDTSKASGNASVALGPSTNSTGVSSTALGDGSQSMNNYATAVGAFAKARGISSVALGHDANATALYATALGFESNASGINSLALGKMSKALHNGSVALGSNSVTADAVQTNNATVGGITYSGFAGTGPGSTVSVGGAYTERTITNVAAGRILSNSTDAINGSQLYATNNVLGNLANAVKNIFGGNATLLPNGTITMTDVGDTGELTIHDAINSIKATIPEEPQTYFHVNNGTNAGTGDATTNLGKVSEAAGALSLNSITAGVGAKTTGDGESAIAIGTNATSDSQSIALGNLANASSGLSIAIGHNSQATGDFSYAMGANSQASSQSSIALGQNSVASNVISIAIGDSAASTGEYALAFGSGANASKTAGIAIGASAQASHDFSVALGGEAATGEVIGTNSAEVNGITYSGFAGNTPFSTVSVGNEEYEQTRTITNVAAGRINENSTDAINGSQLYAVAKNISWNITASASEGEVDGESEERVYAGDQVKLDAGKNIKITQNGQNFTFATLENVSFTNVTTGNTTMDNDGLKVGEVTVTDELLTVDDKVVGNINDAINQTAKQAFSPLTFVGDEGVTERKLGQTFEIVAGNATNTSTKNLKTTVTEGKVEISMAENPVFETVQVGGDNGPKISADGNNIKIGDKEGNPTKITNVAPGELSESSTDAVNGSQLYAVKQDVVNNTNAINNLTTNVGTLANNTIKLGGNNGTTDAQALNKAGGLQFNVKGENGLTTTANGTDITVTIEQSNITQNENGTVSAETKGNTYATAEQVANAINQSGFTLKTSATDGEKVSGDAELINPGDTVEMVAGKNLQVKQEADGKITYATKDNVTFTTVNATTVNVGDTTINNDGLTIKNGPSITKDGLNAGNKVISNVSKGVADNDAVNVGQLKEATSNINSNINNLANNTITLGGDNGTTTSAQTLNKEGGLRFDVNGGNGISTTANGSSITVTAKTDGTTIKIDASGNIAANTGNVTIASNVDTTDAAGNVIPAGKVSVAAGEGSKMATVQNVADAINSAGWVVNTGKAADQNSFNTAAVNHQPTKVSAGSKVNFQAGKNMEVKRDGENIIYATSDNVSFNTVTVGNTKITNDGVSIVNGPSMTKDGIDAGGKRITNVAPGRPGTTDAVNMQQLRDATTNINNQLNKMDKRRKAGHASGLAVAGLMQAYREGQSAVTAGVGQYQNQSAVAVGYSRIADSGKYGVKAAFTANTQGEVGGTLSAGYFW